MSRELQGSRQTAFETEQVVANYLRDNPDFFERHIYLLHSLSIRHAIAGTTSLIERQVNILREENRRLHRKLEEILQVARDNDQLNVHMQRLTLRLMETSSLEGVVDALQESLRRDFQADLVSLRLITEKSRSTRPPQIGLVSKDDPGLAAFAHFFASWQPLCGRLRRDQLEYLFGAQGTEVGSAALVPCRAAGVEGMIAIGSKDPHRFQPGMGTVFLSYLGELVARAIHPYFDC